MEQGNLPLMRNCARSILFGFCSALVIGVLLGVGGSFYGLTHQMEMRGSQGPSLMLSCSDVFGCLGR